MSNEPPKPQVTKLQIAKPSKTPTSPEMKAVKQRSNVKLVLGCIGAIFGTSGGGYCANKNANEEEKEKINAVQQQLAQQGQRLEDHIDVSNERNEELKVQQHKLGKRTRRIEEGMLINKAQNDLVLDKLGVPKNKRAAAENVVAPEEEE